LHSQLGNSQFYNQADYTKLAIAKLTSKLVITKLTTKLAIAKLIIQNWLQLGYSQFCIVSLAIASLI
jgi:hypothetical protein